jgi:hypothetical protein
MFGRLRMALLRRSLQHLVAQPRRQRRPHTLESARSIALLFDASEEETRKVMTLWAESFIEREPRKRLHMLGFIDNEHTVGQTRFPQFTAQRVALVRPHKQPGRRTLCERSTRLIAVL